MVAFRQKWRKGLHGDYDYAGIAVLLYVAIRIEKYKKAITIAAIGIDQYFKEIAVKQNKFTLMYVDRMVTKLFLPWCTLINIDYSKTIKTIAAYTFGNGFIPNLK